MKMRGWKKILHANGNSQNLKHLADTDYPGQAAAAKSLQSCPTLCDPIDGSPPGSSVPGILQAKHSQTNKIYFFK